jgi:hypothetical protein
MERSAAFKLLQELAGTTDGGDSTTLFESEPERGTRQFLPFPADLYEEYRPLHLANRHFAPFVDARPDLADGSARLDAGRGNSSEAPAGAFMRAANWSAARMRINPRGW